MVDEKFKDKATKRFKDGWIRNIMIIEVLASSEEAAKKSLEDHVSKMEKEKNVMIINRSYNDVKKVDNPHPTLDVGYSYIVELETIMKNLEMLIYVSMTYAPSSIEIIEPDKLNIDIGEAQAILNSVAEMIHKFAAVGIGGVIINNPEAGQ